MAWNLTAQGNLNAGTANPGDADKVRALAEKFFTDLQEAGAGVTSFALTSDGVSQPLKTPGVRSAESVAAGMTPQQPAPAPAPQPVPDQTATSPTPAEAPAAEEPASGQSAPSRSTPSRSARSGSKSR